MNNSTFKENAMRMAKLAAADSLKDGSALKEAADVARRRLEKAWKKTFKEIDRQIAEHKHSRETATKAATESHDKTPKLTHPHIPTTRAKTKPINPLHGKRTEVQEKAVLETSGWTKRLEYERYEDISSSDSDS